MTAIELRASYIHCLSKGSMNYWGRIRRTLSAMRNGQTMQTTGQGAAQLHPTHADSGRVLLARYM